VKGAAVALVAAALAFAGCVSAPAESEGASLAAASPGASAPRTTVPFQEQGSTFNGFAVCPVQGQCVGTGLPNVRSTTSWFEVGLSGVLQDVELTLTWQATTPATAELLLGIAFENEAGESDWLYAYGPSPVVLSESGVGIPADKVHAVYVNAFKCASIVCASIEQPFSIEGTLVTSEE